jgi:Domain of unknown function (DUF4124)
MWIRILSVLTAAVLAPSLCAAAQKQSSGASSREAFYRCKDGRGQTHYGDSMPQACAGFDTEVLNDHGMVLRVVEGDQTRAERVAREGIEAKARKELEAREQRDRMLIETYLSVEDIERLRDQRLEMLAAQYRVTEQNITNLSERQNRLELQVARFKPYSDKANAPPLPDHLAEAMVNTVNSMRVYKESLIRNRKEQADVKTSFDADIRRFKELKGLK